MYRREKIDKLALSKQLASLKKLPGRNLEEVKKSKAQQAERGKDTLIALF